MLEIHWSKRRMASKINEELYTPQTATTTQLNDVTDAVNTGLDKVQGFRRYNTTTDNPVYAVGSADNDIWVDGVGSTVHTPA